MTNPPERSSPDPTEPVAATNAEPAAPSAVPEATTQLHGMTTAPEGKVTQGNGSNPALRVFLTPLGLLLGVLILLGLYLRTYDFGYPTQLQFDEHHFVENARGYLKHQSDWNDHPPLGKLLIAGGIKQLGDNSIGFRIPALISGLATILLGALAAARLFRSKWSAAMAAALLSADGFLIAYSRAALLDGFLATASVAALLLVSLELSVAWGCLAGLVLGFAASIKFSGVGVLLPLAFGIVTAKREPRQKLLVVGAVAVVAAFVYVSSYAVGLSMTDKPNGVADVIADTQRLLKHHSELTDMKNPATSGWVTWLLPTRPLLLGTWEKYGAVRTLSTLGNLATWWAAVALAILSIGTVLRVGWAQVLGGQSLPGSSPVSTFVMTHGKVAMACLLAALGFLAPWILTHRDSYIYHFLPAYVPLVLLLSGFLSWYEDRRSMYVLSFVAAVVVVAAFYGPIWAYLPMSHDAIQLRLFVASWR